MSRSAPTADDRLEERDVGGEGDDVEADRDPDPDRVGFVELAQRVAEADQLREEEVDADEQHEDDDQPSAPAVAA